MIAGRRLIGFGKRSPSFVVVLLQTWREQLKADLYTELKQQGDPRMEGKGGVFDQYPHANKGHQNFYERYMKGEPLKAGWVKETDFEKKPLD